MTRTVADTNIVSLFSSTILDAPPAPARFDPDADFR
jgi:hypothetical protein